MLSESQLQQRFNDLTTWLTSWHNYQRITQIAGDASFRRYFRVWTEQGSYIAVDAPPELEDSQTFVGVAQAFRQFGLCVPEILRADLDSGFMLISDFGDHLYASVLNDSNADLLYSRAMDALHVLQSHPNENPYAFPLFTQASFLEELSNFRQWYLEAHLEVVLTTQQENLLHETFSLLLASALTQPQVCVHRDYHSRNLFALPEGKVGVIDFQDAVWGPITYDLVSLIRDCYIAWPTAQVHVWRQRYYHQASKLGLLPDVDEKTFIRWFDWMGIQRHLKALFIFARKWHRDRNPHYLHAIPRTLTYITEVTLDYPELFNFRKFLCLLTHIVT